MKRIVVYVFLVCVLMACERPPEYSEAPTIYFKSIDKYITPFTNGISGRDSIVIALRFEDGDGDVGIDQFDSKYFPYATEEYGNETFIPADTIEYPAEFEFVGDKVQIIPGYTEFIPADTVYDHVNFYIDEYVLKDGKYERIDLDGSKGGRFEPLLTTGRDAVIDGVIEYSFVWVHADIYESGLIDIGDSVRFSISIIDRELNRSNIIFTEPIAVLLNE